jgi:hypothetical protein
MLQAESFTRDHTSSAENISCNNYDGRTTHNKTHTQGSHNHEIKQNYKQPRATHIIKK